MKVSRVQAEENRNRVIDVAGRLFREHGFEGTSLEDIMAAAGLTRGGFYSNFASKEDLMAQACDRVLTKSREQWSLLDGGPDPFVRLVESYVSERHRDTPGRGCMLAALAADAARKGTPVRSTFTAGLRAYINVLFKFVPGNSHKARRQKALATLAGMVGAVALARATNDADLSAEILAAVRTDLTSRSSYGRRQ
jgi:TetR/AcrR family transcriptional repressor of nem operon